MPIKNCLLCDELLITSEEKIYGSHYRCNDKRSKDNHFRTFDEDVYHNPIKSVIAIGIFNSLVIFLFMIALMLA